MAVVIRLALALALFWNLSLVSSLIGSTCKNGNHGPVQGQGPARTAHVYWANPKPSTTALAERIAPFTEFSTPGVVRVKVDFPPRREQYRNLTRAVQYRIIHDEDEDEEDEGSKEATARKYDPYESLRRILKKQKSVFHSLNDDAPTQLGTWRMRLLMAILRPLALWFWAGKAWNALLRKLRLRRTPPTQGFSVKHLGGTKRHYALLVHSLAGGARGQTVTAPVLDPIAYHRSAVHMAHKRAVAELDAPRQKEIRISALQGALLKRALRNHNHRKRNQQG